jgi:nucleotide-binding universal stress UspA family protein
MKDFLVAIDGSEGSEAAIDEALDLAQDVGAHITFAFVRKPPASLLGYPYYERLLSHELATARETLDSATDRAVDVGIDSASEILEGDPVDEISSAVVQHANVPVLVAKERSGRRLVAA